MKSLLFILLGAVTLVAQTPDPSSSPTATPKPKPVPPGYPSPTPRDAPATPSPGITRISIPSGAPWTAGPTEMERDPDAPSLDLYLVKSDKPTTALIIFPGGSYASLAMAWEGALNARFFNKFGISAFVLRYRHSGRFHFPAPLEDAQMAIRFVRAHAADYNIAPDRVGILGCSAGGHLGSMVLTRFDAGDPQSSDPLARLSSRPDFGMLLYPVITLSNEPLVHKGSRKNLLGDDLSLKEELSSELRVRPNTPPTFLMTGGEDETVDPQNSVLFYEACRAAKVPVELHVFQQGGHGLRDPADMLWHDIAGNWLHRNGWAPKPPVEWTDPVPLLKQ